MDESNVDVTPTKFGENCSKWHWILESASHQDLVEVIDLFNQQSDNIYGDATEKLAKVLAKHVMIYSAIIGE